MVSVAKAMSILNCVQNWLLPDQPVIGLPVFSLAKAKDVWLAHRIYIQLNDYCCGVAAAATAVETLVGSVNVPELTRQIGPTERWGSSDAKVSRGLRASGVTVSRPQQSGDFDWVCSQLKRQRIPLFTVNSHEPDTRHWVALIGFNYDNREVFVADSCRPYSARQSWAAFRRDATESGLVRTLVCQSKSVC